MKNMSCNRIRIMRARAVLITHVICCIIRGVLASALAVMHVVKFLCFQLLSQLVDAAFFS